MATESRWRHDVHESGFFPETPYGVGDLIQVFDIAVDDGAARQWLGGVTLKPELLRRARGQFDQFDGTGADIQSDQRRMPAN